MGGELRGDCLHQLDAVPKSLTQPVEGVLSAVGPGGIFVPGRSWWGQLRLDDHERLRSRTGRGEVTAELPRRRSLVSQLTAQYVFRGGQAVLPTIPDKDSAPACMYLAALYQILQRRGQSLLDYYCAILEELGGYDDSLRSIMMSGPEGVRRKNALMKSLRDDPPRELGGCKVLEMVDYWDEERFGAFRSDTDRLPRNVLRFITDAYIVAIRPSGTEPKLKFYCQQLPEAGTSEAKGRELFSELRERSNAFARKVYRELLARVGSSIGDVGLLLPDLVELEQKRSFEAKTVPELRAKLEAEEFVDLEAILAWLRDQVAAMTPGADPLPAITVALAYACEGWTEALGSVPLFGELHTWVTAE